MIREGYIRLHRSMLDWEWYGDEAATRLFLHLLLTANWKAARFRGHEVPPGTLITSIDSLAKSLGWSRMRVRHNLDKLKATNEVTTTTTNHWTAVTLVNWAKYQLDPSQSSQPTTNQAANQQLTSNQPTTTIEEGKKEEGKNKRERRAKLRTMTKDEFLEIMRVAYTANPKVISREEVKAMVEYWTEANPDGVMRFQDQDYFDPVRRMRTWQRRSDTPSPEEATKPKPPYNPHV